MWFDIINLIIGILSLLSTIAISFVIYFLERKNEKRRTESEIKEAAKKFIRENAEEKGYLPWCSIAAGCFPQNNHCRKIYNEFSLLSREVQKEVFLQAKIQADLINDFDWVDAKIGYIKEAIERMDLGRDFLYDGAKYFHRAYDYKEEKIDEYRHMQNNHNLYKDVFNMGRVFLKKNGYLNFEQYLEDYLYCKYRATELMPDNVIKPIDYLLQEENLYDGDEDIVCFWMMIVVSNVMQYAKPYLDYELKDHSDTDSFAETFEDKYFEVLYDLFYFEKKSTKSKNKKK